METSDVVYVAETSDVVDAAETSDVVDVAEIDDVVCANYPAKRAHPYEKPPEALAPIRPGLPARRAHPRTRLPGPFVARASRRAEARPSFPRLRCRSCLCGSDVVDGPTGGTAP